jgi:hypothetical protein
MGWQGAKGEPLIRQQLYDIPYACAALYGYLILIRVFT